MESHPRKEVSSHRRQGAGRLGIGADSRSKEGGQSSRKAGKTSRSRCRRKSQDMGRTKKGQAGKGKSPRSLGCRMGQPNTSRREKGSVHPSRRPLAAILTPQTSLVTCPSPVSTLSRSKLLTTIGGNQRGSSSPSTRPTVPFYQEGHSVYRSHHPTSPDLYIVVTL